MPNVIELRHLDSRHRSDRHASARGMNQELFIFRVSHGIFSKGIRKFGREYAYGSLWSYQLCFILVWNTVIVSKRMSSCYSLCSTTRTNISTEERTVSLLDKERSNNIPVDHSQRMHFRFFLHRLARVMKYFYNLPRKPFLYHWSSLSSFAFLQ